MTARIHWADGWAAAVDRAPTLYAVIVAACVCLAGCSSATTPPASGTETSATPHATSAPTDVSAPVSSEPAEVEEVEDESVIETTAIGETLSLSEAELTVNSVEHVDEFATECGDTYRPTKGRSLYVVRITVTNTGKDVQYPDGQFIGSDMVTFRDSDGNEMQFAFPGCKLPGEETFDGLLSGETGSLPLLIEGATPESTPGWIELNASFNSDPEVVLLDDDLTLTSNS